MENRLSAWVQLGASVGILIGLALVGVQIQQSTEIARVQFVSASFESTIRAFEMVVGEHLADAWSKAMANSDDMTDADLVVIDAYLRREWVNNIRTEMITALGYTGLETTSSVSVRKWVFQYLGNETALRWWRANQSGTQVSMAPELRDAIDAALQAQGEGHHRSHEMRLERLRSEALYP